MSEDLVDFKDIFTDEKVVVAATDFSYYLVGQFPVDVTAVTYGHTSLASDALNRRLCHAYVWRSFNYSDLVAIKASYVIVVKQELDRVRREVESKPYLKLIRGNRNFKVYEFTKNDSLDKSAGKVYQPCLLYQKNEAK
jgi:hypothetical protein